MLFMCIFCFVIIKSANNEDKFILYNQTQFTLKYILYHPYSNYNKVGSIKAHTKLKLPIYERGFGIYLNKIEKYLSLDLIAESNELLKLGIILFEIQNLVRKIITVKYNAKENRIHYEID